MNTTIKNMRMMDYEAKTKTRNDYYTSNLIKYFTVPVDIIGIILSFVLWEPQINDLVDAYDAGNGKYSNQYSISIIIDIIKVDTICLYKTYYIGWSNVYIRNNDISQIKRYNGTYRKPGRNSCNMRSLDYLNLKIEANKINKLILIEDHNGKITREIITDLSVINRKHLNFQCFTVYSSCLFVLSCKLGS